MLQPGHAMGARRRAHSNDELVVPAPLCELCARARGQVGYIRDVHVLALLAIGTDGLDFEEALRHDKVNGARIDEVAAESGNDLPDGFDE